MRKYPFGQIAVNAQFAVPIPAGEHHSLTTGRVTRAAHQYANRRCGRDAEAIRIRRKAEADRLGVRFRDVPDEMLYLQKYSCQRSADEQSIIVTRLPDQEVG